MLSKNLNPLLVNLFVRLMAMLFDGEGYSAWFRGLTPVSGSAISLFLVCVGFRLYYSLLVVAIMPVFCIYAMVLVQFLRCCQWHSLYFCYIASGSLMSLVRIPFGCYLSVVIRFLTVWHCLGWKHRASQARVLSLKQVTKPIYASI